MTDDLWREVDAVLSRALELPESERMAHVGTACAGRPDLEAEVRALLAEGDQRGPLDALDAAASVDDDAGALAGRRVGPYRLLREIGRGGMGSVWLAERDDRQFEKRVAVKLLSAGLPASEAVRRFRGERQILASLEHPHIARLLDAGRSDEGWPFIVMEYVDGVPITDFCRARALPIRARVDLLRTIASTVHFAHQHLVVHLDLKPANILVTADSAPRLLDFGVAKMLAPDGVVESATLPLFHLLTPAYASPEQLDGRRVTTASDIYSLGVLCYELLSGARPDRSHSEPDPPSRAAARIGIEGGGAIPGELSGDLDAIVMKAMRPAPHDRYASAEDLAEDLDRYANGQPVAARRGSGRYRARKFVGRQRLGAAAAALVAVVCVGGVCGIMWQVRVARRERAAAERRFNDVRQLARSMIFDQYDRIAELPGSTAAREALVTKALQYFDGLSREASTDPSLTLELATAYMRVAEVQFNPSYANLGDTAGALTSLASARRVLEAELARDPASLPAKRLLAQQHLAAGAVHLYLHEQATAQDSVEAGLKLRETLAATGDDKDRFELANAYYRFADVLSSRERAASLAPRRQALEMFEALLTRNPDDENTKRSIALAAKTLGSSLIDLRRHDEAEPYVTRALAIDEKRVAANPVSSLARLDLSFDLSLLATLRTHLRDYRGALVYWERTIVVRKALADADPRDARARGRLAFAYLRSSGARYQIGDLRAALVDAQRARSLAEGLLAANPNDAISRSYVAQAWTDIAYDERGLARRVRAIDRSAQLGRACTAYSRALDGFRTNIALGRAGEDDRASLSRLEADFAACRPALQATREK
jgi:eukaryotic-like serine/threonine-protein kinase